MVCPNCYRRTLIRFGKYKGQQRWLCECCRTTTLYPRHRTPKGLVVSEPSSLFLLESRTRFGDWTYNSDLGLYTSPKMQLFANDNDFPSYWAVPDPILIKCAFFVGFWCGKDNDLICVVNSGLQETNELDSYLSPAGKTPKQALYLTRKKITDLRREDKQDD